MTFTSMLRISSSFLAVLSIAIALHPAVASTHDPKVAGPANSHTLSKTGWYFSGKGGPSFAQLRDVHSVSTGQTLQETRTSNMTGGFGMAAGYEWMYRYHVPLRTELEFMNRTDVTYDASPLALTGTSGALASTAQNVTTMANVYWHFPIGSRLWWPYVSAGLGWAHNTVKSQYTPTGGQSAHYKSTSDNLAWSAGAGGSLHLGPGMTNDIELRYVDLGAANWGLPSQNIETKSNGGFSATELIFAIRYNF